MKKTEKKQPKFKKMTLSGLKASKGGRGGVAAACYITEIEHKSGVKEP